MPRYESLPTAAGGEAGRSLGVGMTGVDTAEALLAFEEITKTRVTIRPGSPMELARRLDPKFVLTPTVRLLSDVAVRAVTEPDQQDIVTTPPRTGKSQILVIWTIVWALMRNPDLQIIVAAYADDLAHKHSRKARQIIREHGDYLGIHLSLEKTAVSEWTLDGHGGGVLAAGILAGITGMGADLLLIDDPIKNQQEADSKAHRARVLNEYQSTLATRVHPGGSTILVQTRWHEKDLAGSLIAEAEERDWRHINIPAVSEVGVPDALERPSGVAMVSALGRTADGFERLRRRVGSRAWYALYQGVPSAPEGGLIKREWLNDWRVTVPPRNPVYTVIGVDPSDSGEGDHCGLIAASITSDLVVTVIADKSAPMTSDQWAKAAVELAEEVGASEVGVEGFAARATYTRVVREALARQKTTRPIKVSSWPPKGTDRGRGDAVARSAALIQALEVGTCCLAGEFPRFEEKAITWQAGQHQPDNVAALVVAHDILIHAAGQRWQLAAPPGTATVTPITGGSWMNQKLA